MNSLFKDSSDNSEVEKGTNRKLQVDDKTVLPISIQQYPEKPEDCFEPNIQEQPTSYKPKGFKPTKKYIKEAPEEVVVINTGEVKIIQNTKVKYSEKDSLPFFKGYYEILPQLMTLSSPALRVLCYVISIIKENSDFVYLELEHIKLYTGYKHNNDVYKGLRELQLKNFITKDKSYKYYFNTNYFYNGKRK